MTEQTPDQNRPPGSELTPGDLERIEAWISERLDAAPVEWKDGDFEDLEQAGLSVRQRVADLQWLHGLLLQAQQSHRESQAERIQRAMQALSEQPGEPPVAIREITVTGNGGRSRTWPRLLVAAVVLFCVGLFWQVNGGPTSAQAAVDHALRAVGESRDRQFQIIVERPAVDGESRQVKSQLYVRGPNEFVLDHPGLLPGARIWIGSDSRKYWLVPQIGPVLVSHEHGPLKEWLDQFQVSTPYLQLTTVLTRMRDQYELQEQEPANLPSMIAEGPPQPFRHIRGTLRHVATGSDSDPVTLLPPVIELWVHPELGEVRRLVLEWPTAPTESSLPLRRVTFDLVSYKPQSRDWFQHEGHHQPDRKVVQPGKK